MSSEIATSVARRDSRRARSPAPASRAPPRWCRRPARSRPRRRRPAACRARPSARRRRGRPRRSISSASAKLRADRADDHEVLDVDAPAGMRAAAEDLDLRQRQSTARRSPPRCSPQRHVRARPRRHARPPSRRRSSRCRRGATCSACRRARSGARRSRPGRRRRRPATARGDLAVDGGDGAASRRGRRSGAAVAQVDRLARAASRRRPARWRARARRRRARPRPRRSAGRANPRRGARGPRDAAVGLARIEALPPHRRDMSSLGCGGSGVVSPRARRRRRRERTGRAATHRRRAHAFSIGSSVDVLDRRLAVDARQQQARQQRGGARLERRRAAPRRRRVEIGRGERVEAGQEAVAPLRPSTGTSAADG